MPIPLQNFGNNCYINAALQSIKYLIDDYPLSHDACYYANLTNFSISIQNDAYEFLIILLEKLHEQFKFIPNIVITNTTYLKNKNFVETINFNESDVPYTKENVVSFSVKFCHDYYKKAYSWVQKTFTSQLIGLGVDDKKNQFGFSFVNSIELDIIDQKQFKWPERQFIWKLAPIVIIRLKRFDSKEKLNHGVLMPISIDFNQYKSEFSNDNLSIYHLKSVIQHRGSVNGGHYVSFVKENEQWYLCNDFQINPVNIPDMTTGYVYIYVNQN
jgi:ubiquitin carboxyl-terminal hydrolase 22/27/51